VVGHAGLRAAQAGGSQRREGRCRADHQAGVFERQRLVRPGCGLLIRTGGVSAVIEVEHLTKRYGAFEAVRDLTFHVPGGMVVGFLGRNGAGKSTTLNVLAGLAKATDGSAHINGRPYQKLDEPMRTVGFGLDAEAFHPAMPGGRVLRMIATRAGIGDGRVREVLRLVELDAAADRRVGAYSLGMRQRLLLAAAMLGDPEAIVLDEPTNGLDPQGHRWLRDFLRARAGEGRAVLLSSHVLGDVAETVDRVVVISQGRLVADAAIADLTDSDGAVRVASPQADQLAASLGHDGVQVAHIDEVTLRVTGSSRKTIGEAAARAGLVLYELSSESSSLEKAFFELTKGEGSGLR
jgi:ABC-2 type transport system ATP-binding protein